jgi:membrane-associated phospholipid phosphatase
MSEATATIGAEASAEPGATADGPTARVGLVDKVASAYNVLLALVWAVLIPQWSYAVWLFLAHAAAAAIPTLLARTPGRLSRTTRVLRDLYPLIWILAFWIELEFIRPLLHDAAYDRVIGAIDLAVFSRHLNEVWMPAMPSVWFSEIMHFAYLSYYLTVIVPLLYMLFRGSGEMKQDMTFRVVLVYFACYAFYIAFPVDGPHFLSEHYQGPLQQGLFYRVDAALQGQGEALGCSFPSSHVAASTTMAYLGFRWLSGRAAGLLLLAAGGVALSTVYTQHHFAIDSLAGVIFALWLNLRVAPALLSWWHHARPLPLTPPLR